jgi:hypothetical protein
MASHKVQYCIPHYTPYTHHSHIQKHVPTIAFDPFRLAKISLTMSDTTVELLTYIHHLVKLMDSNIGDWFEFEYKLAQERRWMRIEQTGSPLYMDCNFKYHGSTFETFVKSNKEGMPAYNLVLGALEQVGIDSYTWRMLMNHMRQCCPPLHRASGAEHHERTKIGVSSSELSMVLEEFFVLQEVDEGSRGSWIQVVQALKDVRTKEPDNSGWVFSGYPY